MPARLTLHPPDRPTRCVVVREGESLTVGRASSCGLVLEDKRVSNHHARLVWDGTGWTLTDLGSKNGTSSDGTPVEHHRLRGGEWLSFGGLLACFERMSAEDAAALAQARNARLTAGIELRRRLSADLEPRDLLLRFLQSAMGITRAARGFVLVADEDGRLHALVSAGLEPGAARGETFAGSVGAVEKVIATGCSLVVSDAQSDPELGTRPSVVAMGLRLVACVPLKHGERLLGVIYVDSARPGAVLTELDLEILEALAEHTALVIEGVRLERPAAAPLEELDERFAALAVPRASGLEPSPS